MQTSFASTLLRWATGITLWVGFQAQTSFANDVVWRPELIQAQGVGCRFGHSSDPNQNAYVIANGDSVSFIFTRLGEEFRTGRTPNINLSPCRIILPLEVNAGFYIEEIAQTLTYGIVKSRGVQAQLDFISNFARRLPNGRSNPNDLSQNMANAKAFFPAPQIINEPMAILPQPLALVGTAFKSCKDVCASLRNSDLWCRLPVAVSRRQRTLAWNLYVPRADRPPSLC